MLLRGHGCQVLHFWRTSTPYCPTHATAKIAFKSTLSILFEPLDLNTSAPVFKTRASLSDIEAVFYVGLNPLRLSTMKTLTKMSSSRVSDGTVVHRFSKASSLYSDMDTEKLPSSVFRVMALQRQQQPTHKATLLFVFVVAS